MDKISMTLTVYFEEGFWHGLFEQEHAQSYRVCRVTFGAEPSTQELLDFLNRYYHRLQFSPSIRVKEKAKSISPKRLQRQAKKEQSLFWLDKVFWMMCNVWYSIPPQM